MLFSYLFTENLQVLFHSTFFWAKFYNKKPILVIYYQQCKMKPLGNRFVNFAIVNYGFKK